MRNILSQSSLQTVPTRGEVSCFIFVSCPADKTLDFSLLYPLQTVEELAMIIPRPTPAYSVHERVDNEWGIQVSIAVSGWLDWRTRSSGTIATGQSSLRSFHNFKRDGMMKLILLAAIGATAVNANTHTYECIQGKDFLKIGDLVNAAGRTEKDCTQLCSTYPECNVVALKAGKCYLKKVGQEQVSDKTFITNPEVITCARKPHQPAAAAVQPAYGAAAQPMLQQNAKHLRKP
ncbi:hypothetical protein Ae201684P_007748 [Aphanomyces euteiches]|nr:hypothetical protein Ae201684P_007748 [Aphanomyces euteiches]